MVVTSPTRNTVMRCALRVPPSKKIFHVLNGPRNGIEPQAVLIRVSYFCRIE
eukprot:TRINITY_DN13840_c0_g1_i1.p1 TRINITY_DN13840_c0_g1~~TRINITY_DN13840_c0_g1_i1.p1  ORF type:complete len:52 (+),score=0.97 TRINITY_DN13840_c0_g1_i1:204-359(+)